MSCIIKIDRDYVIQWSENRYTEIRNLVWELLRKAGQAGRQEDSTVERPLRKSLIDRNGSVPVIRGWYASIRGAAQLWLGVNRRAN